MLNESKVSTNEFLCVYVLRKEIGIEQILINKSESKENQNPDQAIFVSRNSWDLISSPNHNRSNIFLLNPLGS